MRFLPIGPVTEVLRSRPYNGDAWSRFMSKVNIPFASGTCWTWRGGRNGDGYSTFNDGRRNVGAHRYSYETLVGPIPEGLELDHLCRNRLCVRPDHLEAVDHRTNVLRSDNPAAKASRRTACPKGHPYDRIELGRFRRCGQCVRDRYHARKAA